MNTFKSIFRNFKKNKVITSLRIISIVLGVGVALYIFELNSFEKSYDQSWPDYHQVYRVAFEYSENGELVSHTARNVLAAPAFLKSEIPGVAASCGFGRDVINVFYNEQQFNEVNWLWSDTTIFQVLNRKIVLAENDHFWNDWHAAVISESFAKKMFGDENPINKRFTLNEGWDYQVKAVFEDIPSNSHLAIDVVASRASLMYFIRNFNNTTRQLTENPEFRYNDINPYQQWTWNTPNAHGRWAYIRLEEGVSIEQVEASLPQAMEKITLPPRFVNANFKFDFQPIADIHLKSNLEQEYKSNGSEARVQFLNLIAYVVLMVSLINFLNLTNIQIIENGKRYAIHVLNGAKMHAIFITILIDNLIVTLGAGLCAVIILTLFKSTLLPDIEFDLSNLIILFIVLSATSLLGTLIPFVGAFKGRFQSYIKTQSGSLPGTWKGRKTFVIIQFCIAIVLIAGTLVIRKQMEYMSNYRLGFEPKQTMFSFSPMSMNHHPEIRQRLTSFKNEVLKVPGVEAFSISSSVPGREVKRFIDNVRTGSNAEPLPVTFTLMSGSEDYTKLFNIEIIAGRNFKMRPNWQSNEVMINQQAAKAMGFTTPIDAIGQTIRMGNNERQIVGVMNDYHHMSLKRQLKPLILEQTLNWEFAVGYYAIRFDAQRTKEVHKAVCDIWERIYPIEVASFHFTSEVFNGQYQSEQKFQQITTYGSLLALLISCIGLFAIAAFDTRKRIKEIGVRKVNGAKVFQVMKMLNIDFLRWVLIGFIIATPLAWYAMNQWLEGFAYRTNVSWWIFIMSGLLAVIIATLTISWKSWQAARRNPVEALRYE